MRRLGWIAAVAGLGVAGATVAQPAPARAADTAAPSSVAVAGAAIPILPFLPPSAAPSPRGPLHLSLAPIAVGGSVERSARLTNKLSLRVTVQSGPVESRDMFHARLAGQMVDFYPAGDHGFHLSAGTKMFNPRAMGPSETAMRGILPSQRRLNIPGMKTSMRRAPALTMGYTDRIDADTSIGFEVGAMKGRAYNDVANAARQTRADRNAIDSPINPMANLVIGHRF
ncbi:MULTISPECIES: hypothetical protein [unclassified Sphingomonas]|jgi:hypothetical protein|uniref:hypothetical protein n=1 Tax=unclassified Sphingomonas TaxID=196159 RepID=UPI000E106161|nr:MULTISPECIES: hypothetical protein [unclassified Sphingomonas]AXJ94773.1 hypothetical protein DM480_03930 [Sphingomonas sp. FARSPH]